MSGARWEDFRRDQLFDGPEFSCAIKAHLDLVIDEQDVTLVQHFLKGREVFRRRDDITSGRLNCLDVESRELRFASLSIPKGVVFRVEILGELIDAVETTVFALLTVRTAEAIREGNEVGAIGKMTKAPTTAVTGSNCRSPKCAPVITAHKRKDQILTRRIAYYLERVFNCLRAADVEMDAAVQAELRLVESPDRRG